MAPLAPKVKCVGDGCEQDADERHECGPVELRRPGKGYCHDVPQGSRGQLSYGAQRLSDSVLDQISDVLHRMLEGSPAEWQSIHTK